MKMYYGVDVSEHNGEINWDAVRDAGATFAICRSTYGRHGRDPSFAENVYEALKRGLACGAYHYGYALTPAEAAEEAENCREYIDSTGALLELPVFYDMEDADGYKRREGYSHEKDTALCRAFLENVGLNAGLYASYSWLSDYIDWESLKCPVWCAAWCDSDPFGGFMWQYTDSLLIDGELFDGDAMYAD